MTFPWAISIGDDFELTESEIDALLVVTSDRRFGDYDVAVVDAGA